MDEQKISKCQTTFVRQQTSLSQNPFHGPQKPKYVKTRMYGSQSVTGLPTKFI